MRRLGFALAASLAMIACGSRSPLDNGAPARPSLTPVAAKCPQPATTPTEIYSDRTGGLSLAIDDTSLYWIDSVFGNVTRLSKCGGDPVTIGDGMPYTRPIPVDGYTYWLAGRSLHRAAAGTTNEEALVFVDFEEPALAVDGGAAYGIAGLMSPFMAGTLIAVPFDGRPPRAYVPNVSTLGIAVDDASIYYLDGPNIAPLGAPSALEIWSVPKSGGPPIQILSTPARTPSSTPKRSNIALDDRDAFWVDDGGTLWRVGKDGSNPQSLETAAGTATIALDDDFVYVADGSVWRVAKSGSARQTIAQTASASPQAIVVDAGSVYWRDGTSVFKVDK